MRPCTYLRKTKTRVHFSSWGHLQLNNQAFTMEVFNGREPFKEGKRQVTYYRHTLAGLLSVPLDPEMQGKTAPDHQSPWPEWWHWPILCLLQKRKGLSSWSPRNMWIITSSAGNTLATLQPQSSCHPQPLEVKRPGVAGS